jgi:hypothetical protein
MMMRIQLFSFGSRGGVTGQSIVKRWSGCSELILTQWEGSVTRRGGVTMSAREEAALRREKGVDDIDWADANLTGQKNGENPRGRFSWYKYMVKI